jgi:5-bromo-4-chloroindolyl phosphate hydrolysis protein
VNDLIRKGRAWAPVLKSALLFVLPAPLLISIVIQLASGRLTQLATTCAALAALWGAGLLTWRALVAEARYFLGELADPPRTPMKAIGAALTAGGAALMGLAGDHGIANAVVLAALAGVGHVFFYGADLKPRRIDIVNVDGVDVAAVTATLKQAYGRLRGIETAAHAIAVPEFGERLSRITAIGHDILSEIERDPRDASRARKFLNLYLDSAERVTTEYARTHRQLRSRPLEDNFRQLLVDMESTFDEQRKRLLENDLTSLDVEIEVLNTRLKREGVN